MDYCFQRIEIEIGGYLASAIDTGSFVVIIYSNPKPVKTDISVLQSQHQVPLQSPPYGPCQPRKP